MANVNAQLGLVITARDEASQVFEEFAKNLAESFKGVVEEGASLDETFRGVSEAALGSSREITASMNSEREEIYMTRSELLDWARANEDSFKGAGVAINNFADISNADLKRVMEETNDVSVKMKQDLEGIADITDGPLVKSQNKWAETVIMSGGEIRAVFTEIIAEHEELEKIADLVWTDEYSKMAKVIQSYEGYNIVIDKARTKELELAEASQSANNGMKDKEDTLDQMKNKLDEVATSSQGANEKLGIMSHSDALLNIGMQAQMAGESVTGFLRGAVHDGTDFQQHMDAVAATLNSHLTPATELTKEQMEEMSQKALELGANGYFSANQVSDGMYTLARQGIDYQNIMGGAMDSIQNLAVATDSDLTSTSNVVSDIIHEMGSELSSEFGPSLQNQFTGVANMISGAMHNARMSMDDFLNTMKYVGPQAGAMGMSLQDVSTAIALLGEHGIKSSQAGTVLRRMMQDLVPSTKPAKEEMEALGIVTADGGNKFLDATGHVKSFAEIQGVLHDALAKLTPAQQEQALKTMFSTYALSGMTVVANTSKSELSELTDEVTKNSNAADLAKAKWNDTAGQMRELNAHWETIKKIIGEELVPALNSFAGGAESVLKAFDSLSPGMKQFVVDSAAVGGGLLLLGGNALTALANLSMLGVDFKKLFGISKEAAKATAEAGTEIAEAGEVAGGATVAVEGAAGGVGMLSGAIELLLNPITLAVGALVGLGFYLHSMYQSNEDFRTSVNRVGTEMSSTFTHVKEYFFGKDYIADIKNASNQSVATITQMSIDTESKLMGIKTNAGAISQETADAVIQASNKMKDMSVQAADDRMKKEIDDATFLKDHLKSVTDEQAKNLIADAQSQRDESVKAAQDMNQKVLAQIDKLRADGVKVTDDMKAQIIKQFEEQRDGSIKACSDTEVQANTIIAKLKAENGKITQEMASQTIKDANKQRDGAIQSANDTYNQTVAKIVEMRDKYHVISGEQADDLIAKAKAQKDGSVKEANEMHDNVIATVKSMAGDNMKNIDEANGHILSGWQQTWNSLNSTTTSIGNSIENWVKSWASRVANMFSNLIQDAKAAYSAVTSGPAPTASGSSGSTKRFANGGILMNPTIFGMAGDSPMLGGEAGPEAILPLSDLPSLLGLDKEHKNFGGNTQKTQVNNITINVNGQGKNGTDLGNDIAKQLRLQMSMVSI